jgi:hypothetical protein
MHLRHRLRAPAALQLQTFLALLHHLWLSIRYWLWEGHRISEDAFCDASACFVEEGTCLADRRGAESHQDVRHLETVGVSFSGGGVRSAAFNCGVLEALCAGGEGRPVFFQKVDYLSCVSGGGYAGTAFAVAWSASMTNSDSESYLSAAKEVSARMWNQSNFIFGASGTSKPVQTLMEKFIYVLLIVLAGGATAVFGGFMGLTTLLSLLSLFPYFMRDSWYFAVQLTALFSVTLGSILFFLPAVAASLKVDLVLLVLMLFLLVLWQVLSLLPLTLPFVALSHTMTSQYLHDAITQLQQLQQLLKVGETETNTNPPTAAAPLSVTPPLSTWLRPLLQAVTLLLCLIVVTCLLSWLYRTCTYYRRRLLSFSFYSLYVGSFMLSLLLSLEICITMGTWLIAVWHLSTPLLVVESLALESLEVTDEVMLLCLMAALGILLLLGVSYRGLLIVGPAIFLLIVCNVYYERLWGSLASSGTCLIAERILPTLGLPSPPLTCWEWLYLLLACLPSLLLIPLVPIQIKLVHWFYRWRLRRAFYGQHPDVLLSSLNRRGFPLLLCQTTLNDFQRPSEEDNRSYAPFILSPLHCGSMRTGYWRTAPLRLSLSRVMAISGAAVSPSLGKAASNRVFRLLSAILHMSLADWVAFPYLHHGRWLIIQTAQIGLLFGVLVIVLLDERLVLCSFALLMVVVLLSFVQHPRCIAFFYQLTLVRQLHMAVGHVVRGEKPPPFVYLSDGGHTENLGVYELLRRRCNTMLVFDAGSSANTMAIQNAMAEARRDLGCVFLPAATHAGWDVEKVLEMFMAPDSDAACLLIRVVYFDGPCKVKEGKMYFCKCRLPQHLAGSYRDQCKSLYLKAFPYHSTAMQFFSKKLFRLYRELGLTLAKETVEMVLNDSQRCTTVETER